MLFEKFANDYARCRPGYPEDLLILLIKKFGLDNKSLVLDLACGTGNLGRQIQKLTNAVIFGLDYSLTMLKHCKELFISSGKAEIMPFKTGSFDAVFTGQAFHWFDFERALFETNRVIKPGGGLAIVWYYRKRPHTGHQLKMDELIKKYNPDHEYVNLEYNWQKILNQHGGFCESDSFTADCVLKYSIPDYLKLQRSKSYIGDALSPEVLPKFLKEYEEIIKRNYPGGEVLEKMTYQYVSTVKS